MVAGRTPRRLRRRRPRASSRRRGRHSLAPAQRAPVPSPPCRGIGLVPRRPVDRVRALRAPAGGLLSRLALAHPGQRRTSEARPRTTILRARSELVARRRHIAYGDNRQRLWVVSAGGGGQRALGPVALRGSNPRCSPDGHRVAFIEYGTMRAVSVLDLDTGKPNGWSSSTRARRSSAMRGRPTVAGSRSPASASTRATRFHRPSCASTSRCSRSAFATELGVSCTARTTGSRTESTGDGRTGSSLPVSRESGGAGHDCQTDPRSDACRSL